MTYTATPKVPEYIVAVVAKISIGFCARNGWESRLDISRDGISKKWWSFFWIWPPNEAPFCTLRNIATFALRNVKNSSQHLPSEISSKTDRWVCFLGFPPIQAIRSDVRALRWWEAAIGAWRLPPSLQAAEVSSSQQGRLCRGDNAA